MFKIYLICWYCCQSVSMKYFTLFSFSLCSLLLFFWFCCCCFFSSFFWWDMQFSRDFYFECIDVASKCCFVNGFYRCLLFFLKNIHLSMVANLINFISLYTQTSSIWSVYICILLYKIFYREKKRTKSSKIVLMYRDSPNVIFARTKFTKKRKKTSGSC